MAPAQLALTAERQRNEATSAAITEAKTSQHGDMGKGADAERQKLARRPVEPAAERHGHADDGRLEDDRGEPQRPAPIDRAPLRQHREQREVERHENREPQVDRARSRRDQALQQPELLRTVGEEQGGESEQRAAAAVQDGDRRSGRQHGVNAVYARARERERQRVADVHHEKRHRQQHHRRREPRQHLEHEMRVRRDRHVSHRSPLKGFRGARRSATQRPLRVRR
jgi:hypothetical protein